MKISIIIPCYNEAATIEHAVSAVKSFLPPDTDIIVVDDFSTDGTRDILRARIENSVAVVRYHSHNCGKGACLRTGFQEASGDIIVVQDADLEYDPRDVPRLIQPIIAGWADVVYGSRFISSEPRRVFYFWHSAGNKLLTLLSNMLTNLNLTDMETGYKAFHRQVINRIEIEEDRFGFEPEITAKVAKLGCRIYEIGISYRGRTYAEGKKITWRDGISAIRCIVKYNWFRR